MSDVNGENFPAVAARDDRLVWVDLEMTGLDLERHVIVEVAALVTDANLNILGEGWIWWFMPRKMNWRRWMTLSAICMIPPG